DNLVRPAPLGAGHRGEGTVFAMVESHDLFLRESAFQNQETGHRARPSRCAAPVLPAVRWWRRGDSRIRRLSGAPVQACGPWDAADRSQSRRRAAQCACLNQVILIFIADKLPEISIFE